MQHRSREVERSDIFAEVAFMHSLRGSHFIQDRQVCMKVVLLKQKEALVFWSLPRSGGDKDKDLHRRCSVWARLVDGQYTSWGRGREELEWIQKG